MSDKLYITLLITIPILIIATLSISRSDDQAKCKLYGQEYELRKGTYDVGYCVNANTGEMKGLR